MHTQNQTLGSGLESKPKVLVVHTLFWALIALFLASCSPKTVSSTVNSSTAATANTCQCSDVATCNIDGCEKCPDGTLKLPNQACSDTLSLRRNRIAPVSLDMTGKYRKFLFNPPNGKTELELEVFSRQQIKFIEVYVDNYRMGRYSVSQNASVDEKSVNPNFDFSKLGLSSGNEGYVLLRFNSRKFVNGSHLFKFKAVTDKANSFESYYTFDIVNTESVDDPLCQPKGNGNNCYPQLAVDGLKCAKNPVRNDEISCSSCVLATDSNCFSKLILKGIYANGLTKNRFECSSEYATSSSNSFSKCFISCVDQTCESTEFSADDNNNTPVKNLFLDGASCGDIPDGLECTPNKLYYQELVGCDLGACRNSLDLWPEQGYLPMLKLPLSVPSRVKTLPVNLRTLGDSIETNCLSLASQNAPTSYLISYSKDLNECVCRDNDNGKNLISTPVVNTGLFDANGAYFENLSCGCKNGNCQTDNTNGCASATSASFHFKQNYCFNTRSFCLGQNKYAPDNSSTADLHACGVCVDGSAYFYDVENNASSCVKPEDYCRDRFGLNVAFLDTVPSDKNFYVGRLRLGNATKYATCDPTNCYGSSDKNKLVWNVSLKYCTGGSNFCNGTFHSPFLENTINKPYCECYGERVFNSAPEVKSCEACPSGSQKLGNVCVQCAAGFYNEAAGSQCKPCKAGEYSDKAGSLSCKPCESGKYCKDGIQSNCPSGFFCPSKNILSDAVIKDINSGAVQSNPNYPGAIPCTVNNICKVKSVREQFGTGFDEDGKADISKTICFPYDSNVNVADKYLANAYHCPEGSIEPKICPEGSLCDQYGIASTCPPGFLCPKKIPVTFIDEKDPSKNPCKSKTQDQCLKEKYCQWRWNPLKNTSGDFECQVDFALPIFKITNSNSTEAMFGFVNTENKIYKMFSSTTADAQPNYLMNCGSLTFDQCVNSAYCFLDSGTSACKPLIPSGTLSRDLKTVFHSQNFMVRKGERPSWMAGKQEAPYYVKPMPMSCVPTNQMFCPEGSRYPWFNSIRGETGCPDGFRCKTGTSIVPINPGDLVQIQEGVYSDYYSYESEQFTLLKKHIWLDVLKNYSILLGSVSKTELDKTIDTSVDPKAPNPPKGWGTDVFGGSTFFKDYLGYHCESLDGARCRQDERTGAIIWKICPAGFYCPLAKDLGLSESRYVAPVACVPHHYSICPAGFEPSKAIVDGETYYEKLQKPCTNGYTCPDLNSEVPCPSGKYCCNTDSCLEPMADILGRGQETKTLGMHACPEGYFCGGNTVLPITCGSGICPKGSNRPSTICPPGFVCAGGAVVPCPAGSYCSNGIPKDCDAGYYCPSGASAQVPCPAGYACARNTGDIFETGPSVRSRYVCNYNSDFSFENLLKSYSDTNGNFIEAPLSLSVDNPNYTKEAIYRITADAAVDKFEEVNMKVTQARYWNLVTNDGTARREYKYESTYCPAMTSSNLNQCPAGFYCPNSTRKEVCPSGFFCPKGSGKTLCCDYILPSTSFTYSGLKASQCKDYLSRTTCAKGGFCYWDERSVNTANNSKSGLCKYMNPYIDSKVLETSGVSPALQSKFPGYTVLSGCSLLSRDQCVTVNTVTKMGKYCKWATDSSGTEGCVMKHCNEIGEPGAVDTSKQLDCESSPYCKWNQALPAGGACIPRSNTSSGGDPRDMGDAFVDCASYGPNKEITWGQLNCGGLTAAGATVCAQYGCQWVAPNCVGTGTGTYPRVNNAQVCSHIPYCTVDNQGERAMDLLTGDISLYPWACKNKVSSQFLSDMCWDGKHCTRSLSLDLSCSGQKNSARYCKGTTNRQSRLCPAGFYCPSWSDQFECPPGNYCPAGSPAPLACPSKVAGSAFTFCCSDFNCNNGVASLEESLCPAGYFCIHEKASGGDSGTTSAGKTPKIVKCPTGSYCPKGTGCQIGDEKQVLIIGRDDPDGTLNVDTWIDVNLSKVAEISYKCIIEDLRKMTKSAVLPADDNEVRAAFGCPTKDAGNNPLPQGTAGDSSATSILFKCISLKTKQGCEWHSPVCKWESNPNGGPAGGLCYGGNYLGYVEINPARKSESAGTKSPWKTCTYDVNPIEWSPCPEGFFCRSPSVDKVACPAGSFCPTKTSTPLACPSDANGPYFSVDGTMAATGCCSGENMGVPILTTGYGKLRSCVWDASTAGCVKSTLQSERVANPSKSLGNLWNGNCVCKKGFVNEPATSGSGKCVECEAGDSCQ